MRIRRLELCGFKSFGDRTVFQFADGISAVVGPNGCGKSNVLDAIRWLLGEQNARLLRGQGMEDVIFGGASGRAATGVAEATLVLDNADDSLGERFSRFPEVEVSRRLFRDGESVYQINGARCRLKDVVDLFMDTGVGARASSVIEQGRVVDLINSKPSDRRALIDEAAGIVGYKARRQEAQRRLETTEQNLLRVGDVADELRRQANALRRQAAKANRYRKLQAYRKQSEVLISLAETHNQTDRYRDSLERLTDLQGERDRLLGEERTTQVQLDAAREQTRNAAAAVDELKERLASVQRGIETREREREFCRREADGLERRAQSLLQDCDDGEARSKALAAEVERLRHEETDRQQELKFTAQERQRRERDMAASESALKTRQEELSTVRAEDEQHNAAAASLRSNLDGLAHRSADHHRRLERLAEERERADARLAAARERREEVAGRQGELEAEVGAQRAHLAEVADELEGRRGAWAAMMASIGELTDLMRDREARRQSLEEVLSRFEGFGAGVRAALRLRDETDGGAGIVGTVADVLEVPAEYEQAIEAALGTSLQSVLVREREHGVAGVAYLAQREAGRTTFVPLSKLRLTAPPLTPDDDTVAAVACEVVATAPEYEEAIELLLGGVLIVADLETALQLRDSGVDGHRLATLAGDVVEVSGAITGGAGPDTGVLGQKRELRQVVSELADLRAEEADARSVVESISTATERLEEDRVATEARLHALDVDRARIEGERRAADREVEAARQQRGTRQTDAEHTEGIIADIERQRAAGTAELSRIEEEQERSRGQLEHLGRVSETLQGDLEQHRGRAFQARLDATSAKERLESARARRLQVEERGGEVAAKVDRDREERSGIAGRMTELEAKVAQLGKELERGELDRTTAGEMVERAIAHHGEVAKGGLAFEERIGRSREERAALEEQIQSATTQVALIESELEHLRDDLRQGYDLDLKQVFATMERDGEVDLVLRGTLPRALGEDDGEEAGDSEEVPAVGHADEATEDGQGIRVTYRWDELTDAAALEERRRALIKVRVDLQRIGEINMAAPEAYQQVKGKHDELRKQTDDLEASIERIRRGIAKLNRTSRERFAEAFEQVNVHFRELYPRLTGGGQAYLALTSPEDLLETGLEVHVQPPGKKLKAMGLLSGGEKAMAALSLLFAVFLHRPSPFCLLDEVDAELDEANVRRLAALLREMRERTQFVVITHTRRTMEVADVLFGVTMEQPGVSKLVSVKLEDVAVA